MSGSGDSDHQNHNNNSGDVELDSQSNSNNNNNSNAVLHSNQNFSDVRLSGDNIPLSKSSGSVKSASSSSNIQRRYSHHIHLDKLEDEHSPQLSHQPYTSDHHMSPLHSDANANRGASSTPDYPQKSDYEVLIAVFAKASSYISKALDIIENRSREENKEWQKSNSEYYKKVLFKCQEENRLDDAKSMIYTTWISQIESHYSTTSPEINDVISNLRRAHETLFDEDGYDLFSQDQASLASSQQLHNSSHSVPRRTLSPMTSPEITSSNPIQNEKFKKFYEKSTKWMLKKLTIIDLIKTYKKEYLQYDISVGLSSGSIIIPQSMAYALLAGMPPIYGLYSAFIPSLVYCLFGTSKHLAVGPLALMSILIGSSVQSQNPTSLQEYIGLANILSLLIGINFLIMSFMQLGFLINFLSRPVLSGFTSAAAVIIILSMATSLFGIPSTNQKYAWAYVIYIAKNMGMTNWIAVVMSVFCFALLYVFKNYLKTIPRTTIPVPAPLILVVLGLVLSYTLDLEGKGIAVVGSIPKGLPSPSFFDNLTVDIILNLYKDSLIIPIVGLIETVSIASVAATKAKYEINMNQELFSLGMANVFGGIFQAYGVAGAFGRSSLHLNSGAKTQLTTIISVFVVGITLLFLTPLFYYLPKVILSCIVIMAVVSLIDLEEVQNLWRINKVDMFLLLVAFWSTIVLGVQPGVASAVLLSIILILVNSSRPNTSTMGRLAGTASYNDCQLYPEAIIDPHVVIFRFDAPLIFVNAYYLRKKLKIFFKNENDDETEFNQFGISNTTGYAKKVKAIILDCSSVTSIDSTGIKYLKELVRELVENNVLLCFADVRANVIESLQLSGIYRDIGADHFFMRVHEAVKTVPNLKIRPIVEQKAGLRLNCFKKDPSEKYQEIY